MKRSLVVFVALGLLAGLVGCSDSSDEIAELRAELDATRAELTELISTKADYSEKEADYSEKEEYKDEDDNELIVSVEETVDFFTICFASNMSKQHCAYAFNDVIVMRKLVPDDEICLEAILVIAINRTAYGSWGSEEVANSRYFNGPDDAYLLGTPSCLDLDNEDS